jgi:hypothetical protein
MTPRTPRKKGEKERNRKPLLAPLSPLGTGKE